MNHIGLSDKHVRLAVHCSGASCLFNSLRDAYTWIKAVNEADNNVIPAEPVQLDNGFYKVVFGREKHKEVCHSLSMDM